MKGTESIELIDLCKELLEDAEVTVEEVFKLAAWLEQHEEARRTWPGEVLAPVVQAVVLDGKVNKTEVKKVASLLRRIQKEWSKRLQEKVQQDAIASAESAARAMDLSVARLPRIHVTLTVKLQSDEGAEHAADLGGPSCDCPDWTGRRAKLPVGDLTRCCKHVLDAFGRVRPPDGWPGWLEAFLEHGWTPHPEKQWDVMTVSRTAVLVSSATKYWADVYSPEGQTYNRFGYNVQEQRWSYGLEPAGAAHIVKRIGQGFVRASAPAAKPTASKPQIAPALPEVELDHPDQPIPEGVLFSKRPGRLAQLIRKLFGG